MFLSVPSLWIMDSIGSRVWGFWKVHLSSGAGRHRPSHPRTSHWHKPSPEENLSAHRSLFHCSAWFLSKLWKQKKAREVFSYRRSGSFTFGRLGSFWLHALVSLHIWAHLRHCLYSRGFKKISLTSRMSFSVPCTQSRPLLLQELVVFCLQWLHELRRTEIYS